MSQKLIQMGFAKQPELAGLELDLEIDALKLEDSLDDRDNNKAFVSTRIGNGTSCEAEANVLDTSVETEMSENHEVGTWLPPEIPNKALQKQFKVSYSRLHFVP